MTMPVYPQPIPEESNEAFAERKRQWARQTAEWIKTKQWIDYPYLPEDYNPKNTCAPIAAINEDYNAP